VVLNPEKKRNHWRQRLFSICASREPLCYNDPMKGNNHKIARSVKTGQFERIIKRLDSRIGKAVIRLADR